VTLPSGSFIRALPFAVDETQRFRVDALVVGADILGAAYIQLVELALRSQWQESQSEEQRAQHVDIGLFQHAWSMVDQIYSLRLLLLSLKFGGDDVDAFMAATGPAYVLRNRMDHLDARIPNIAASKSQTRSLFGSLSYFVQGAVFGAPQVDAFLVTRQAEPMRQAENTTAARFPAEMRKPIGNFSLYAAGEELDLDNAILTLGTLMTKINAGLEKSIRAQIAEKVAELGIKESDALAHLGARYKLMFPLKHVPGDGSSPPQWAMLGSGKDAKPPENGGA
jgi:hypothetical protein